MRLFGKHHDTPPASETVSSPVEGKVVALDAVPDPVFGQGLMGPGFAVEPSSGTFVAPVDGTVTLVAPTLHAVGMRTPLGAELIVHIGIDTVALKGEGFRAQVDQGQEVRRGDPLITCDLESVAPQVPSMISPVVITNAADFDVQGPDLGSTEIMRIQHG